MPAAVQGERSTLINSCEHYKNWCIQERERHLKSTKHKNPIRLSRLESRGRRPWRGWAASTDPFSYQTGFPLLTAASGQACPSSISYKLWEHAHLGCAENSVVPPFFFSATQSLNSSGLLSWGPFWILLRQQTQYEESTASKEGWGC